MGTETSTGTKDWDAVRAAVGEVFDVASLVRLTARALSSATFATASCITAPGVRAILVDTVEPRLVGAAKTLDDAVVGRDRDAAARARTELGVVLAALHLTHEGLGTVEPGCEVVSDVAVGVHRAIDALERVLDAVVDSTAALRHLDGTP